MVLTELEMKPRNITKNNAAAVNAQSIRMERNFNSLYLQDHLESFLQTYTGTVHVIHIKCA